MFLRIFQVTAIALSLAGSAHAAESLGQIQGSQDRSPEALQVTVLSVVVVEPPPATGCAITVTGFTVTARIDVVRRGDLQPGQIIRFSHSTTSTPCPVPGGNHGVRLIAGDRADAYLRPGTDGVFIANDLQKLH
jgi:hypothetical protein